MVLCHFLASFNVFCLPINNFCKLYNNPICAEWHFSGLISLQELLTVVKKNFTSMF
jgi:hypothetical protein